MASALRPQRQFPREIGGDQGYERVVEVEGGVAVRALHLGDPFGVWIPSLSLNHRRDKLTGGADQVVGTGERLTGALRHDPHAGLATRRSLEHGMDRGALR